MGFFARRRHLFEFGDQPWLRGALRAAYVDCLNVALKAGHQYRRMHQPLAAWVSAAGGADALLDIGSGGGGPVDTLLHAARHDGVTLPRLVLSDLYPNAPHYRALAARHGPDRVGYVDAPVPAAAGPRPGLRLRTFCSVFHHFRPADARAVIDDAVRHGDGLFVMEPFHRDLRHFLFVLLNGPFVYLLAPFVARPFRWATLLFGLLVPLAPLLVWFDGCVSVLRTYTPAEIEALFPPSAHATFEFRHGACPYVGGRAAWFCAWRRRAAPPTQAVETDHAT